MITLKASNCIVKRVLVDRKTVVEIMFYSTFQKIGLPNDEIVLVTTPLVGFDGALMIPTKTIRLEVITGNKFLMVKFIIVNATSSYNVINGHKLDPLYGEYPFNIALGNEMYLR